MKSYVDLDRCGSLRIVSGEGEVGTIETYTGKRTLRAIKSRLTRERCAGARWARCEAHAGETSCGAPVWIDVLTGRFW